MSQLQTKTMQAFDSKKRHLGNLPFKTFRICILLAMMSLISVRTLIAQEHKSMNQEEKEKSTAIPKTLPGIWSNINENLNALHNALTAGKLTDIHHYAFAIRDLVAAMPSKSSALAKEKQTVLSKSVTRVASLAKFLDEAGDKGDSSSVATYIGKLDKELKTIDALYPTQTLKAKETNVKPDSDATAKHGTTHGY